MAAKVQLTSQGKYICCYTERQNCPPQSTFNDCSRHDWVNVSRMNICRKPTYFLDISSCSPWVQVLMYLLLLSSLFFSFLWICISRKKLPSARFQLILSHFWAADHYGASGKDDRLHYIRTERRGGVDESQTSIIYTDKVCQQCFSPHFTLQMEWLVPMPLASCPRPQRAKPSVSHLPQKSRCSVLRPTRDPRRSDETSELTHVLFRDSFIMAS